MMKQNLLKTIALGLLAMVGVNAWADNTVRYSTDGGSNWTEAADLNALSSVLSAATTNINVEVSVDQTLSGRLTWDKAYTLTITPTANITIKGPQNAMWFLANVNNAVLNIGSSTYSITLDGDNKTYASDGITRREKDAIIHLTNITFKDFNLNSACCLASAKSEGVKESLILENITIENCTNPNKAYIVSERVVNDVIILKGYLNIDASSTGTAIYTKLETKYSDSKYTTTGRIKVDDSSASLTATKTIIVTFTEASTTYVPQIGAAIIINSTNNWTDETASVFALANDVDYGVFRNNKDLKLTQAYTLEVTSAGAATLVLPFASKIPSGISAYTLTHTSGLSVVNAAAVETTLAANTPVLINAAEGSYKFVSTATSGDMATGSDPVTSGALTGVYSDLAFTAENIASTYPYVYILNKIGDNVGFYKAASGKKVGAYKAYLTATNVPAGARLSITFDDSETTAISEVRGEKEEGRGEYYDLSGRRIAQPTKGLYVVNGKKVVIK